MVSSKEIVFKKTWDLVVQALLRVQLTFGYWYYLNRISTKKNVENNITKKKKKPTGDESMNQWTIHLDTLIFSLPSPFKKKTKQKHIMRHIAIWDKTVRRGSVTNHASGWIGGISLKNAEAFPRWPVSRRFPVSHADHFRGQRFPSYTLTLWQMYGMWYCWWLKSCTSW